MKRVLFRHILFLLLGLYASCSHDIVDTTGNLSGVISDSRTGAFVSGVSVTLTPTGKSVTTGSDGKYEFRNLESQEYFVSVGKEGYESDKKSVFVQSGEDNNLDFKLVPSKGELQLSQSTIDFGNKNTTLTFDIANIGKAPLLWELSEDITWLSCNPTSGTIQQGEKTSVILNVDRTGLKQGSYSQTIAVSSNGGSANIRVSMSVQGLAVSVSPEKLDFGSTTTAMELSIVNESDGNISYTLSPSNEWIKLSQSAGTFSKTESVTVSVDRTSLSGGDYSGSLTLTVGENNINIPVMMNIPSKEKPTITIQLVEDITFNSAVFKGAIAKTGSSRVYRHGFCWSVNENPDINSSNTCNLGDSEKAKDFTYIATDLAPNTTYYVRAYAENMEGISYSNLIKFSTTGTPQPAEVETGNVSGIRANSAQVSGNIIHIGNTDGIIQYGHVWSTTPNPTTTNKKTELGRTESTGAFNSALTELSPNTTYYVKAYAINSVGTSYGKEISFTTLLEDVTFSITSISNITYNSATCHVSIKSSGGHIVAERGVCWSKSKNPTTADNSVRSDSAADNYSVDITGLAEYTLYHVRAYVRTADDNIFYSNDITFTTTENSVNIDRSDFGEDNNWTR